MKFNILKIIAELFIFIFNKLFSIKKTNVDVAVANSDILFYSTNCVDLIKFFEGLKLQSYLCPANVWTIGYGHTRQTYKNQLITKRQAEYLLRQDLNLVSGQVNAILKKQVYQYTIVLSQSQFDAIVSFVYNIGIGNFRRSTFLNKLRENDYVGAANEFSKWIYAKGRKLPGLIVRRRIEKAVFLAEDYSLE